MWRTNHLHFFCAVLWLTACSLAAASEYSGQVVFGWIHGLVGQLPGRPDLYEVIRRGEARRAAQSPARRCYAVAAAGAAVPLALAASAVEVAARSGGTIYVQARRDRG